MKPTHFMMILVLGGIANELVCKGLYHFPHNISVSGLSEVMRLSKMIM